MNDFVDTWQRFHPNSIPVNDTLKFSEPDVWERIHSLPQSKQYPETDEEMSTVLHRQNAVASEVLGIGSPCWMIGYLHIWSDAEESDNEWWQAHVDYFRLWTMSKVANLPDPDDAELSFDIFATRITWEPGAFDAGLRAIANDELRILWMSEATGAIFAPYDGGVDLILPTADDVMVVRRTFNDWLANHYPGRR